MDVGQVRDIIIKKIHDRLEVYFFLIYRNMLFIMLVFVISDI